MWILPKNLKESFHAAQGFGESSEDLNGLASELSLSCTWKSKHSSAPTWLGRWKRVYWLPHPFGRILQPSMPNLLVDWGTESLEATLARRFQTQEKDKGRTIRDTFTLLFQGLLKVPNPSGAYLKMLKGISRSDLKKSQKIYEAWAILLRQECIQRKKLAHPIEETASLFSQLNTIGWKTPGTQECNGGTMKKLTGNAKYKLRDQVNWPTPQARDSKNPDLETSANFKLQTENGYTIDLNSQVLQKHLMADTSWPTPKGRDWKGASQRGVHQPGDALENMMQHLQATDGRQDQEKSNTTGKSLEQSQKQTLNAAWVAQLQGTTLEKTFFVHMVTP